MGRKIFSDLLAPDAANDDQSRQASHIQPASPSVGGLRESLREITANSIRDLDPDLIDTEGPQDRIDEGEDGVSDLAESIRLHGQQVPIMVRPAGRTDRFLVVYGRRRLAAARMLGIPVKAIVRSLDDDAAILAQGQENNCRLDPSFIEKALFVRDMKAADYKPKVIQDALGVDRAAISRFGLVTDHVPDEVIIAIGPAHSSGRRPWMELADLARGDKIDLIACLSALTAKATDSDGRLRLVLQAARRAGLEQNENTDVARGQQTGLHLRSGREFARMKRSGRDLTLAFSTQEEPGFADWLQKNAEKVARGIHDEWMNEAGAESAGEQHMKGESGNPE